MFEFASSNGHLAPRGQVSLGALEALQEFSIRLGEFHNEAARSLGRPEIPSVAITEMTYAAVVPYAMAFLRKAAILLHVRYGVDFPDTCFTEIDKPELDRLTRALRLPTLPEMFASVGHIVSPGLTVTEAIVFGWIRHWIWAASEPDSISASNCVLSHPGIYELVGLPKNYDTLTHEAMRRKCPTTGKELADPALCLFCGDIFCSQASCCQKESKGGCSQHMTK